MSKQTSIEWLFAHLVPHLDWSKVEDRELFRKLKAEAEQMRKEEIKIAYKSANAGFAAGVKWHKGQQSGNTDKLNKILETFEPEQILTLKDMDDCVIGFDELSQRLIYSEVKIIERLMEDMYIDYDEAVEYFEYNIKGVYIGDNQPIICTDNF